ncbi:MAG: hypothetical protein IJR79_02415 [Clostridia bacterium]|nr:hypothetical protein [Clostridia bacterium]MBQ7751807.1 hypothetical protein [Clostridia bacterium]
MKQRIKKICKIFISGVFAFLILTAFCYFYYNVPVHKNNTDGSTDYKWEPNVFYSRGTEGFASGRTNNEGFVNVLDYNSETPIDILIMGSSHIQAFEVPIRQSTTSRLQELTDKNVYNIGVSSHGFSTCCCNLEAAAEKYEPSYIVIETGTCFFSEDTLNGVISGTLAEIPAHTGGIAAKLQKNQFLRLLYAQVVNYNKKQPAAEEDAVVKDTAEKNNEELLTKVLEKVKETATNHDAKIIIAYHPPVAVNSDATLIIGGNRAAEEQFAKTCKENDIYFLNMNERFAEEYEKSYILPYGFINTTVGSGHLNKYGHKMMAEELYKIILEVE